MKGGKQLFKYELGNNKTDSQFRSSLNGSLAKSSPEYKWINTQFDNVIENNSSIEELGYVVALLMHR